MVWRNLSSAFPEKSQKKSTKSIFSFTRISAIKWWKLSSFLSQHQMRFQNDLRWIQPFTTKLFSEGKHVLQATSHQFNWEWGNWILNHHTPFHLRIIYMIQKNKSMEKLVNEYRVRYGTELIPANDLKAMMTDLKQPTMTVFLADQNPSDRKRAAWVNFFGSEIPFPSRFGNSSQKKRPCRSF
jgi:lauroyl/myristoyl acyltransferase